MSWAPTRPAARGSNPLLLPLAIASGLAGAEAIALVILLVMFARQGPAPPAQEVSAPAVASGSAAPAEQGSAGTGPTAPAAVPAAGTTPPQVSALPHGSRGQRVESSGFAITVENIIYEPRFDPLGQVNEERRYLALLLLVENNTGKNVTFHPVMFRLQDSQSYEYEPLAMKLTAPSLDWRNMGNRETVRGYVDFTVPRSAKGLTLVYTQMAQPIRIDLGE